MVLSKLRLTLPLFLFRPSSLNQQALSLKDTEICTKDIDKMRELIFYQI